MLAGLNRMTREGCLFLFSNEIKQYFWKLLFNSEISGISEMSRNTTSTSETVQQECSSSPSSSTLCDSYTTSTATTSDSTAARMMVISRSFDANNIPSLFPEASLNLPNNYFTALIENARKAAAVRNHPSSSSGGFPYGAHPRTLTDLEMLEELEDMMLLTYTGGIGGIHNPSVHFRSR